MQKLMVPLALGLLLSVSQLAFGADVVARVGGNDVTVDEVRAFVVGLPAAEQAELAADPQRLSQAVRAYLTRDALLKEAKAKKFDQQPETKAQLERVRESALIELYLASVAKVPEDFPSAEQLKAAYDANASAFIAPRQYRLAQIFVAAPDKAAEAGAQGRLAELQKRLKAKGADFGALAREYSANPAEAAHGGEIGWVPETQILPEIKSAVAGLGKDGVAEPIRLADGWHVIKLLDTKAAAPVPLADVRQALAEKLREKYAASLRQAYLAKLAQENPAAINELALAKMFKK